MKYYARIKKYVYGNNGTIDGNKPGDPYLTHDKFYEVKHIDSNLEVFEIDADNGDEELFCLLNGCAHLGGGDWEILSEDEINAMVDDLWETVD